MCFVFLMFNRAAVRHGFPQWGLMKESDRISSYHLIVSYLMVSYLISSYHISYHCIISHNVSSHCIPTHLILSYLNLIVSVGSDWILSCCISSHLVSSHALQLPPSLLILPSGPSRRVLFSSLIQLGEGSVWRDGAVRRPCETHLPQRHDAGGCQGRLHHNACLHPHLLLQYGIDLRPGPPDEYACHHMATTMDFFLILVAATHLKCLITSWFCAFLYFIYFKILFQTIKHQKWQHFNRSSLF